jgi:GTP-binding protein
MTKKLPIVTIVGRQNVGKSTLFNAIIKKKRAIVDPLPGLTRDVIQYNLEYDSVHFTLSDTPGLDLSSSSELSGPILQNAREHLKRSAVILLLMENPAPESFDIDLADIIRKLSIPTIIAVNKMDDSQKLLNMANFYETGFNEIIPVSALNRFNMQLLMDSITRLLPESGGKGKKPDISLAIVGRPNSGKSTLLNSFIGFNRSVVSDIPGTTRDSVDEDFTYHKKLVRIIDTAGIRKKSRIKEDVEFYSFTRTRNSVEKSDVVIHIIDAEAGLTDTDKKISDEIMKARKPIIIGINKWDKIEKDHTTFNRFRDKLVHSFYRAEDFPIISVSAMEKLRINRLLDAAFELKERANRKISTPLLNRIVAQLQKPGRIPQLGDKLRVYYAVQTDTIPPEFKFFVNNPDLFRREIIRYFEKNLQKELEMKGIPIVIHVEGKKKRKGLC